MSPDYRTFNAQCYQSRFLFQSSLYTPKQAAIVRPVDFSDTRAGVMEW